MLQYCFRNLVVCVFSIVLCADQLLYADDDHKWGKITPEEWAMTPPADFPHAPAVVLFDIGSVKTGLDGVKFERHIRHKIFDRLAAGSAINVEIRVSKDDDFGGFSAQTYLPSGKKHSYSSMKLLKKKISDILEVYSFTFPAVEDGCIIEYKYNISDRSVRVPGWQFQNDYFTLESQFSFTTTPYFIYNTVMIGLADSLRTPEGENARIDGKDTKRFTWALRDIPPFVEEPFQGAQLNFRPSMYFQLSGFKFDTFWGFQLDSTYRMTFLESWPDMARRLSNIYDEYIVLDDTLRKVIDSVLATSESDLNKQIQQFWEFVRNEVTTTNDELGYHYPSQTTAETLRRRAGTATDKNLLLVAILQTLKHDVNPLLIASRDHARFTTAILNENQFNYMLCHMRVGSTDYLLDANSKEFPFPHLPPNLRADGGLVLTGERLHRFELGSNRTSVNDKPVDTLRLHHADWKSGIRHDATITLAEDGSAICSSYVTISGYEQDVFGSDREDTPNAAVITKLFNSLKQKTFDIVEVTRNEPVNPDSVSYRIVLNISDFSTIGGGLLACMPSLLWSGENSLTSEKRQFPVDFYLPSFFSETLVLNLPGKYKAATLPANASQITPDLLFSRAVLNDEHSARVMTNVMFKRYFFHPEEYHLVRDFYQKVTSSINESLTAAEQ